MNKVAVSFIIILFLIGGLVFFALGFILGSSLAQNPLQQLYDSRVIQHVNAYALGTITAIEGRSITLKNSNDSMTIPIREPANIARILAPENPSDSFQAPIREPFLFENLKVGDRINIFTEVNLQSALEGIAIDVIVSTFSSP